jgi:hypothetical protein
VIDVELQADLVTADRFHDRSPSSCVRNMKPGMSI